MNSYLKFLSRHRWFTFINIVGLCLSMAFLLLLGDLIYRQTSVENYQTRGDRTFVVGGHIEPVGQASIGGLAAWVEKRETDSDPVIPVISNSEAALDIICPSASSEVASGGLVGFLLDGQVASCMAMPTVYASQGYPNIGGLIGRTGDPHGLAHTSDITVKNSFTNAKFLLPENPTGILVGGRHL